MTPEQRREYQRKWRAANPDKVRAYNRIFKARHGPRKWTEHRADLNRRWRAKNIDHLRAYWAAKREHIRKLRVKFYWKHREQIIAKRKKKYRENPQPIRALARKWAKAHPDRVHANKLRYYQANRERLKAYSRAHYYRNHAAYLAKNAERRKKKREQTREWSKKRTASLCDSYIREQLAKYSPLSTKDFPPELVELKRQHMLARKELQKYEKHERTARYSL